MLGSRNDDGRSSVRVGRSTPSMKKTYLVFARLGRRDTLKTVAAGTQAVPFHIMPSVTSCSDSE